MKKQSTCLIFLMGVILASARPADSGAATKVEVYPLTIHFDFAKSDLKLEERAKSEFDRIADEMHNYPYARLEIEGHTDTIGPVAVNQKLSEERAEAVRQHFIERYGISPDRIVVRAFGKMRPQADNGTTEGRAWNRRAMARVYRLEPGSAGTDQPTL